MNFKLLLSYLTKLNKNNNRDWFENNRTEFETLKLDFLNYLQLIIGELSKADPHIADLEAKKSFFRINRDVRFSKDKTPYKNNFGASIKADGKKSPFAGYYIHIQPGKSFLAGGLYLPEANILQKVRDEIDYNEKGLRNILKNKKFIEYFSEVQGDQLKNPPKGYDKDHSALDLLKFKSFLMMHPLEDKDICDPAFFVLTKKVFGAMVPLNNYLNKAISYKD